PMHQPVLGSRLQMPTHGLGRAAGGVSMILSIALSFTLISPTISGLPLFLAVDIVRPAMMIPSRNAPYKVANGKLSLASCNGAFDTLCYGRLTVTDADDPAFLYPH